MSSSGGGSECTDAGCRDAGAAGVAPRPVVVLKFGGTSLGGAGRVRLAARRVRGHLRRGTGVVVVVSAMGDLTDRTLRRLDAIAPGRAGLPSRERDRALSTGEDLAAALLSAALIDLGVAAVSLRGGEAGLVGAGDFGTGEIARVDPLRLRSLLDDGVVPVVSGFQAMREDGETVTLGRSGSDTTAACIAAALEAEACHIVTDVAGVHDRDPNLDPSARLLPALTFDELLSIVEHGGRVVHPAAVRHARASGTPLRVYHFRARLDPASGSVIAETAGRGDAAAPVDGPAAGGAAGPRPLRVALAGCGVVGGELVRLARAAGAPIEFVRVLVREPGRERDVGLRPEVFTADVEEFLRAPADVVVEAIGGLEPAGRIARAALARGCRVVTANKALIAESGDELAGLAALSAGSLDFEAAVGGGVPMIRTLREGSGGRRPERLRGILNGTANYILTLLGGGVPFAEALARAQANGFAEADPSRDLDGRDAADKIRIAAWLAYGVAPGALPVRTRGILPAPDRLAADAASIGGVARLIAECGERDGRVTASVEPVIVPAGSELARVTEERNHLAIESGWSAPITLSGPGAGGRPTAAAMLGDILRPCGPSGGATRESAGGRVPPGIEDAPRSWLVSVTHGVEDAAASLARSGLEAAPVSGTEGSGTVGRILVQPCRWSELDRALGVLRQEGADPLATRVDEALIAELRQPEPPLAALAG